MVILGGHIKVDVDRVEVAALNQKINKEVFDAFKVCVKEQGYQLNIILEVFMLQYANGRFNLKTEDVLKFKNDGKEVSTLNTTFNKEIYLKFKSACKLRGLFVKHVLTAFMEKYTSGNYILEYRDVTETK